MGSFILPSLQKQEKISKFILFSDCICGGNVYGSRHTAMVWWWVWLSFLPLSHKSYCPSKEIQSKFCIPTNTWFRIPQRSTGMANAMVKSNPPLDPKLITTEKQMVSKSRTICSLSVGSFPSGEDRAIAKFLFAPRKTGLLHLRKHLIICHDKILSDLCNHRNVRSDIQQGKVSGPTSGM